MKTKKRKMFLLPYSLGIYIFYGYYMPVRIIGWFNNKRSEHFQPLKTLN